MLPEKYNLLAVVGPTASGKTAFAAHLASEINGEVISADSRQVYRRMNIGTGKDYEDYVVNGKRVPVHLTDITEPGYKYSVFEYQRDFSRVFSDITVRQKTPVLCGGSGMYIDAVTRNYRLTEVPENAQMRSELKNKSLDELTLILTGMKKLHNKTDTDTTEHALRAIEIEIFNRENIHQATLPDIRPLYIAVVFERKIERERITNRLIKRLNEGLIDEVSQLLDSGIPMESLTYYGLEYRYVTQYITGNLTYETMVSLLNTAIHQFAKRQRTWLRKMEREGCNLHWLDGNLSMQDKLSETLRIIHMTN